MRKEQLRPLDEKKRRLDALRPLPPDTLRTLREKLVLEWTYHSNAIEGNTLTLKETKVVLEGITVGGKSLREHLEAINHREAIFYVEDIVARRQPLSERLIREVHSLILKGIDDRNAGVWRRENVVIAGAEHKPPDFLLVPDQMRDLVEWHGREGRALHPVERAARLHSELVRVHPFVDGNGRTARLLMNLDLLTDGYPPAVIRKEDRLRYYDALDTAHTTGKTEEFMVLVAERVEASLDLYLEVLGGGGSSLP